MTINLELEKIVCLAFASFSGRDFRYLNRGVRDRSTLQKILNNENCHVKIKAESFFLDGAI